MDKKRKKYIDGEQIFLGKLSNEISDRMSYAAKNVNQHGTHTRKVLRKSTIWFII